MISSQQNGESLSIEHVEIEALQTSRPERKGTIELDDTDKGIAKGEKIEKIKAMSRIRPLLAFICAILN